MKILDKQELYEEKMKKIHDKDVNKVERLVAKRYFISIIIKLSDENWWDKLLLKKFFK
jgi:hypothetical protein